MKLNKNLCLTLLCSAITHAVWGQGNNTNIVKAPDISAQQKAEYTEVTRPKIAVVLAGGGAKGVSHIAALKAIEDAGIPIDMVVGTSIGSIVGGLYCAGYSPDTMKTIIANTDWIKMITDNPDFGRRQLSVRKDNEQYVLRFAIDPKRRKSMTGLGGVIQGQNVLNFFKSLTYMLPDSLDFQDLPIPFACVGTEAVNGTCKVFTSGNLPMAIRASMAIPTVFTPVSINDTVYVDGGVVDNFPVDIARQMGADIVIGVDLIVQKNTEQMTNSAIDLLMNCVDLYGRELLKKNRHDTDIYIPIDVTGYNAASFAPAQLDTLMARGDYYVSLKKASLDSLGRSLNLDEAPQRIRVGDYSYATTRSADNTWQLNDEEVVESFRKINDGFLSSSINIGGRFDSREYATIAARFNLVLSRKWASLLTISTRLGDRLEIKGDYSMRTFGSQRFGINYRFQKCDLQVYNHGYRDGSMESQLHKLNLYLTQEWHNVRYTFGMNYNFHNYNDVLTPYPFLIDYTLGTHLENENADESFDMDLYEEAPTDGTRQHFSYYMKSEFNSLDSQVFPHRGQRIELSADLITNNLYQFNGKHPNLILAADWKAAIPIHPKTTLIPHLNGRIIFDNGTGEFWPTMNMVGGLFDEMYYMQLRTFAGVNNLEYVDEHGMAIGGITVQHQLFKNQFILLKGDYLLGFDKLEKILDTEKHIGFEAGYMLRTTLGPVGAKLGWSNLNNKVSFVINAGYYF